MTGRGSRNKGMRAEREFAGFLTERGIEAHKSSETYQTGRDCPDIMTPGLPIHWECKRCECLRLWPALGQAVYDCPPGKVPVVAHRSNKREWIVILPAADFVELLKKSAPGCPQAGSEGQTHVQVLPKEDERQ